MFNILRSKLYLLCLLVGCDNYAERSSHGNYRRSNLISSLGILATMTPSNMESLILTFVLFHTLFYPLSNKPWLLLKTVFKLASRPIPGHDLAKSIIVMSAPFVETIGRPRWVITLFRQDLGDISRARRKFRRRWLMCWRHSERYATF